MMTNEEILAILRQYPDLVPEALAILTEAPAKTDLPVCRLIHSGFARERSSVSTALQNKYTINSDKKIQEAMPRARNLALSNEVRLREQPP